MDETRNISTGKKIKELREKNGWSQEELAFKVGASRSKCKYVGK